MKTLITGGAGFIGQHLVRALSRHHSLRVLDSLLPQIHGPSARVPSALRDIDFMLGDVCDPATARAAVADMDAVVHLSAQTGVGQSMYEVQRYVRTNELGTAELLQAMIDSNPRPHRLVLASSRATYGEGSYLCENCGEVTPRGREAADLALAKWDPSCPHCKGSIYAIPTHEDAQPSPQSVYAASKLAQEHLCRIVGSAYGISVICLRYFNVYGPGQSLANPYTGILSTFFSCLSRGDRIEVFEDGLESRDFIYIQDVVDATVLALCVPGSELEDDVFNVGTGIPLTLEDLAGKVVEAYGGAASINHGGGYRIGDVRHVFADTRRAEKELGFRATTTIEAGISEWMKWARAQQDAGAPQLAQRELERRNLYRTARMSA